LFEISVYLGVSELTPNGLGFNGAIPLSALSLFTLAKSFFFYSLAFVIPLFTTPSWIELIIFYFIFAAYALLICYSCLLLYFSPPYSFIGAQFQWSVFEIFAQVYSSLNVTPPPIIDLFGPLALI